MKKSLFTEMNHEKTTSTSSQSRLLKINTKIAMLSLLMFSVFGWNENVLAQVETFTTSGSWTAPAGVTCITVKAWGAGGGGGGTTSSSGSAGGGGGGGFASSQVAVIPGTTYSFLIGNGGAGSTGGSGKAADGGDTWFYGSPLVKAAGGVGGQNYNSSGWGSPGTGGSGGSLNIGTTTRNGGNGANGSGSAGSYIGGGGGGGAGTTTNGNNGGAGGTAGNGGVGNPAGNGGTGKVNATGANGSNYGGGGGGTGRSSGGPYSGGNGAGGYLTIEVSASCPTYDIALISVVTVPSTVCLDSTYKVEVSVKNNTGAAIPSSANTYAIDYSFNNSTWINNAAYVNNIANGATSSYLLNMASFGSVGSKLIYIRVRKVTGNVLISSGAGIIKVDYCPKAAINCSNATTIGSTGLIQGNTTDFGGNNGDGSWLNYNGSFQATIENIGYYQFVANKAVVTFTACTSCNSAISGIQFYIFTQCGVASSRIAILKQLQVGSGAISIHNFSTSPTLTATNASGGCSIFTLSGLTIGQTYYWGVDGFEGGSCPFTIQFSSGIVLPIELTSFTGTPKSQGNLIQWETASERINDYFEVESTIDGINFNSIGRVAGAGSKSTASSYQLLDTNPAGQITYYRLRQVDYEGEFEIFDVISVERKTTNEVFVSPNPVLTNLNVEMETIHGGSYSFTLIGVSGAKIESKHYLEKGCNNIQLNMRELAKGFYMLQVADANGITMTMKKIIKE